MKRVDRCLERCEPAPSEPIASARQPDGCHGASKDPCADRCYESCY